MAGYRLRQAGLSAVGSQAGWKALAFRRRKIHVVAELLVIPAPGPESSKSDA